MTTPSAQRAAKTPLQLVEEVIDREGPYVNHPADRGGPTTWGVTVGVARQHGYTGRMEDLPRSFAVQLYLKRYYKDPQLHTIAEVSGAIAEELFDTGVNAGPHRAATFLQRALNALNREERDYPDVKTDGRVGPATVFALSQFLKVRGAAAGELVILRALEALQGAHYITLAETRKSQEAFVYGWLANRLQLK